MRHFQDGVIAVSVADQQPRGDERPGDSPLGVGQRAALHPAAGRFVLADRDELEQSQQHRACRVGAPSSAATLSAWRVGTPVTPPMRW